MLSLAVSVIEARAANPSFQDFNTAQFSVAGNKVSLKNGAFVTNLTFNSFTIPGSGTNYTTYHFPLTNCLTGQFLAVVTNGNEAFFYCTNLPTSTFVFDTIEELVATPIPLPGIGMLAYVRDPLRGGPLAFYPNSVDTTNRFDTYASLDGPGNWKRPPDPNTYVQHGVVTGGVVTNETLVAALVLQSARAVGKVVYSGTDEFLETDDVPLLDNNILYFEDGAQATGLNLSSLDITNASVFGSYHIAAVADPSVGAYHLTNSTVLIQSPKFVGYSGNPVANDGSSVRIFAFDTSGFVLQAGNGLTNLVVSDASGYTGAGTLFLSDDGTYRTAGSGAGANWSASGTTNSTLAGVASADGVTATNAVAGGTLTSAGAITAATSVKAATAVFTNGVSIPSAGSLSLNTDEGIYSSGPQINLVNNGNLTWSFAPTGLYPAASGTQDIGLLNATGLFRDFYAMGSYYLFNSAANANYQRLRIYSSATNVFNLLPEAAGTANANISLNLQSLGTGTVQVNGVPIGGGSVATDAIWDAKGDLAGGTGANTAARLAVGGNGLVLTADSAEVTGMKWASVAGTGDFVGPASSADTEVVLFDGATGKLGKRSVVKIGSAGAITAAESLTVSNTITAGMSISASDGFFTDSGSWTDLTFNPGVIVDLEGNRITNSASINNVVITAPVATATLTLGSGKTATISNTLTFTGTDASSVAFGTGGTVAYTANNLSVFAATTSLQLYTLLSNETGSGSGALAMFNLNPEVTGGSTVGGGIKFLEPTDNGTSGITVKAPNSNITSDKTITLPDATGTAVLEDNTATLANKTLTTPTIASFANAGHNHQNAAGGGALDAAAVTSGVFGIARLATGTPDGTKFVRDDGTLAVPAGGSGLGYTMTLLHGASSPADSATYYFGRSVSFPNTTHNNFRVRVPKAGTLTRVELHLHITGTLGSGETVTFYVRLNDTTDLAQMDTTLNTASVEVNNTSVSQILSAGDWVAIKTVNPAYVTNPINVHGYCTLYIE